MHSDVGAWVGFTLFKLRLRLTPAFGLNSRVERPQRLLCADNTSVTMFTCIQVFN